MYCLRGITGINDERASEEESIASKFDYDGMLAQKKATELLTGGVYLRKIGIHAGAVRLQKFCQRRDSLL